MAELEPQEQGRRNHDEDDGELDPLEPVPFASCEWISPTPEPGQESSTPR